MTEIRPISTEAQLEIDIARYMHIACHSKDLHEAGEAACFLLHHQSHPTLGGDVTSILLVFKLKADRSEKIVELIEAFPQLLGLFTWAL